MAGEAGLVSYSTRPVGLAGDPRRLQHFVVTPRAVYDGQNQRVKDGEIVAHGSLTADENRLITVKRFLVTAAGNRLILKPRQP
ncbi:MAG TPA: hypothetical protein VGJ97_13305 [Anaerolineaceae bacterium]|jgi:hypothetical protein